MEQRLLRARYDRKVAGVCGGLATYFDIDPTIVRLVMVLLFATGPGFLMYPILWLITPTEGVRTNPLPPAPGEPTWQAYVPPSSYDPRQQNVNVGTPATGPFRFDPYTGQPITTQQEQVQAYTGDTVQYDQSQPYIPPINQPVSPPAYVPPSSRGRQRRPMLGMLLVAIGIIAVASQFGMDEILTPLLLIGLGVMLLVRKGRL